MCVTVPNFVPIGQVVAEIWPIFEFFKMAAVNQSSPSFTRCNRSAQIKFQNQSGNTPSRFGMPTRNLVNFGPVSPEFKKGNEVHPRYLIADY